MLLAHLAAKRLVLEVSELQLVEDTPDLDPESRLLVVTVEPVCHGYDPDALEVEFRKYGQHEVVVASEAGEVVDQNDLELSLLRRCQYGGQPQAVPTCSRLSLVGVDVIFKNRKSTLAGETATRGDLIFDAFGALVL